MQRNLNASKGLPLGEVQVAWEQLGTLLGGCLSLQSSCSQYHPQTPPTAWPLPKLSESASFLPWIINQLFTSWDKAQVTKQRKKKRFLKVQNT